jgi:hypothetical protein
VQNFSCDNGCGFTAATEDEFEFRLTRPAAMNRGEQAGVHLFNTQDCLSQWAIKDKKAAADQAKAQAEADKAAETARKALADAQAAAQEAADVANGNMDQSASVKAK